MEGGSGLASKVVVGTGDDASGVADAAVDTLRDLETIADADGMDDCANADDGETIADRVVDAQPVATDEAVRRADPDGSNDEPGISVSVLLADGETLGEMDSCVLELSAAEVVSDATFVREPEWRVEGECVAGRVVAGDAEAGAVIELETDAARVARELADARDSPDTSPLAVAACVERGDTVECLDLTAELLAQSEDEALAQLEPERENRSEREARVDKDSLDEADGDTLSDGEADAVVDANTERDGDGDRELRAVPLPDGLCGPLTVALLAEDRLPVATADPLRLRTGDADIVSRGEGAEDSED